jgi:hypothetical protein
VSKLIFDRSQRPTAVVDFDFDTVAGPDRETVHELRRAAFSCFKRREQCQDMSNTEPYALAPALS